MTWRQELGRLRVLLLRHHRALKQEGKGRADVAKGVMWVEIAAGAVGDALKDLPREMLRLPAPGVGPSLEPEQVGELAAKMHLHGQAMGHEREQRSEVVFGADLAASAGKRVAADIIAAREPAKRGRTCGICSARDHDKRLCPKRNETSASAPSAEEAKPEQPPEADDEEPEPAFVFPRSESLNQQKAANKRGPHLAILLPRPEIRAGSCTNELRPCPWAGCKHNLAIWDVTNAGTIKYARPGETFETLTYTCVLDVVRANPDGATLEVVGSLVGLTRERVRQVEMMAIEKGGDEMPASAA